MKIKLSFLFLPFIVISCSNKHSSPDKSKTASILKLSPLHSPTSNDSCIDCARTHKSKLKQPCDQFNEVILLTLDHHITHTGDSIELAYTESIKKTIETAQELGYPITNSSLNTHIALKNLDDCTDHIAIYNSIENLPKKSPTEENQFEINSFSDVLEISYFYFVHQLDFHSNYIPKRKDQATLSPNPGAFGLVFHIPMIEFYINHITSLFIEDVFSGPNKQLLAPNDVITHIDGISIDDSPINILKKIQSPQFTQTHVTISGKKNPIEITKGPVKSTPITAYIIMPTLDFEIGYIKLRNFKGKNVGDNFNEFSSSLDALLLTKPKGLIIDLRQNGGGFIGDALSIADILVDTQSLAYVFNPYKNKFIETNSKTHTLPVQVNDRLKIKTTLPIITLIDNLSASASDLLAGVLQSTGRSLIIGDRSYGKGIAQTPLELSTPFIGTSHVTSFMFFLPDGTSPQKTGITPDIRIVPNDFDAILDQHISETLHRNEIVDDVRMENLPQDISINNRSLAQQIGFTHAAPWKPIWDISALISKIKSTLPSENFNSHFHFPHDRELSYAIALFTHFNSDFQSIYGGHAHGQNQLNNATARKHSTRIPTP